MAIGTTLSHCEGVVPPSSPRRILQSHWFIGCGAHLYRCMGCCKHLVACISELALSLDVLLCSDAYPLPDNVLRETVAGSKGRAVDRHYRKLLIQQVNKKRNLFGQSGVVALSQVSKAAVNSWMHHDILEQTRASFRCFDCPGVFHLKEDGARLG